MRVLLLTDYPAAQERAQFSRLFFLGREMARNGHSVRVVGSRVENADAFDERPADADRIVDGSLEVVGLSYRGQGGLAQGIFPFRPAVRREIAQCDALIVRGYWIGFWSLLYAAATGKKTRMFDLHGFVSKEQWGGGRYCRALSTWLLETGCLRLSTTVLAVSRGVRGLLGERFGSKCIVVENGVDCRAYGETPPPERVAELRAKLALLPHRHVFAVVAHYVPWLDMTTVAQAAALVPEADLVLAGDGPALDKAKEFCAAEGTVNVRFPGMLARKDVDCLLTSICRGCLCPYDPTWGNSAIPGYYATRKVKEYLAAGRAVIVADVAAKESFLIHGETCVVCRPADAHDLAAKMRLVCREPDLTARIGASAREKAREFDWSNLYRSSGLGGLLSGARE